MKILSAPIVKTRLYYLGSSIRLEYCFTTIAISKITAPNNNRSTSGECAKGETFLPPSQSLSLFLLLWLSIAFSTGALIILLLQWKSISKIAFEADKKAHNGFIAHNVELVVVCLYTEVYMEWTLFGVGGGALCLPCGRVDTRGLCLPLTRSHRKRDCQETDNRSRPTLYRRFSHCRMLCRLELSQL